MTLILYGSAVRFGKEPRPLSANSDIITFILYDTKRNILLTKTSGTGIDQSDDGTYIITVPAEELNNVTFPNERYRYAVRLVEGDTGAKHVLSYGPFLIEDLPF